MSNEDYDKLTPAEREVRDKQDRLRERAEQAGRSIFWYLIHALIKFFQQLYPILGDRNLEMWI